MKTNSAGNNPAVPVIAVLGLPGSGKSCFAVQLADALNGLYVSSDLIRNSGTGIQRYDSFSKGKIYREMCRQLTTGLNEHRPVILDATFYRKRYRKWINDQAAACHSPCYFIEVVAPEHLIQERFTKKRANRDADFIIYLKIKKKFEPLTENHLILHSDLFSATEMIKEACAYTGYRNG